MLRLRMLCSDKGFYFEIDQVFKFVVPLMVSMC